MASEFVAYLELEGECRRVGIQFYSMETGPLLYLRGKWMEPSSSPNDDPGDQGPDTDEDTSMTKEREEEEFGGGQGRATEFRQGIQNTEVKIKLQMIPHEKKLI